MESSSSLLLGLLGKGGLEETMQGTSVPAAAAAAAAAVAAVVRGV